jgi:inhibitor of cysteine peptidase
MADKLMRTTIVMSFFLVMALFSGCGTNGTSLTNVDNGKQINVKAGDTITLILESNPTTGYSWQVMAMDGNVLTELGESEYKSDGQNVPGTGGTETFRFKVVESGKTTLELGYMRPWESVQPLETFAIQVVIQ